MTQSGHWRRALIRRFNGFWCSRIVVTIGGIIPPYTPPYTRSTSRVGVTRRNFVAAMGTLTASALLAGAGPLRNGADGFKSTITTLFWVGEPSGADNAFIPNDVSYWDQCWQTSYGGVDDPDRRN